MKKGMNRLFRNAEKWSNILKNPVVFTLQVFNGMFNNFSTLRRKGLNYGFQEYFKGIITIIFCKSLNLRNVETLQSKQNLFKVCSKILISKNLYHYRELID